MTIATEYKLNIPDKCCSCLYKSRLGLGQCPHRDQGILDQWVVYRGRSLYECMHVCDEEDGWVGV